MAGKDLLPAGLVWTSLPVDTVPPSLAGLAVAVDGQGRLYLRTTLGTQAIYERVSRIVPVYIDPCDLMAEDRRCQRCGAIHVVYGDGPYACGDCGADL